MPLAPGARVASYRIEALLGEGGMGAVYRARDERLGRTVALKVIAHALPDDESLARFRREARALAAIQHPNVLALHEASWDGTVAWLALELAAGGSLAARVRRMGNLDWRDAARIGAEVARGLAALHAQGLVHRDLKPANVLFGEDGKAKVADLGLVRGAGTLVESRRLTATGEILGTPEYLSPEQANGEPATAASDVFALGSTVHALLTGRPPFEGRGPALLYQILKGTPPALRELAPDAPPALEDLVARLLEKPPGKRPTASEAAEALEAIARAAEPRARRRGAVVAAIVVAAAAPVVAALVSRATQGQPPAPSASARVTPSAAVPAPATSPQSVASPGVGPKKLAVAGLPAWVSLESAQGAVERVDGWGDFAFRHCDSIVWVGFTRAGLTTSSLDGTVRTWLPDGSQRALVSFGNSLSAGAATPSGTLIAGTVGGLVAAADMERAGEHGFVVRGVARDDASPISAIAAWGEDGFVWGRMNGAFEGLFPGLIPRPLTREEGRITAVAASADGRTLAFAVAPTPRRDDVQPLPRLRVFRWRRDDGIYRELPRPAFVGPGETRGLALSSDGSRLLVARTGKERLAVFELRPDATPELWSDPGPGGCLSIALLDDDRALAILDGGDRSNLSLARIRVGSHALEATENLGWNVPACALGISPLDSTVAVALGATVELRDPATLRLRAGPGGDHRGNITALAYARDGRSALECDERGTALVRDLATGRTGLLEDPQDGLGRAHRLSVSAGLALPDGRWVTAGLPASLKLWGRERSLDRWADATLHGQIETPQIPDFAAALAFDATRGRVIVGGKVEQLATWDMQSLDLEPCERVKSDLLYAVGSAGAGRALTAVLEGVGVWDTDGRRSLGEALPAGAPLACAAGSPDESGLAASLSDGRVAVLTRDGRWSHSRETGTPAETIACAIPEPGRGLVVSAAIGDGVRVWRWPGLELVETIAYDARMDRVVRLAVAPDARSFLAGTKNGVVFHFVLR